MLTILLLSTGYYDTKCMAIIHLMYSIHYFVILLMTFEREFFYYKATLTLNLLAH